MKKIFMDTSKIIKDNAYKLDTKTKYGITTVHFKVEDSNEKTLKRIKGDYYAINFDYTHIQNKNSYLKKELMRILKLFLKDKKDIRPLIVGLGNANILCDSLGLNVTKRIIDGKHFSDFLNMPKVAVFNPSVIDNTGISSFDLIEMVVNKLKPTIIIMVDALATDNEIYLNNCIEVNDTGIIPGAELKNNKRIDKNTFNIPVISLGVPLILEHNKFLYTTPNVGEIIKGTSKIISDALIDLFF